MTEESQSTIAGDDSEAREPESAFWTNMAGAVGRRLEPITRAWNRFFFEPYSTLPLAIYRIFYGLLALQFAWLLYPDLKVWFGSKGIISVETVVSYQGWHGLNVLNFVPENDTWLYCVFAAFVLGALSITVGFCTRFSAILVFLGYVSLHHRDPYLFNGGDNYIRLIALYMIFSQAGNSLSIDRLLADRRGKKRAYDPGPWAQRMMQIQLCLLYVHSVARKIVGPMWQNGIAIYYSSRLLEFRRFPLPYVFDHMWTINLLTYGALAAELALGTLIWVPRLRYYVIAAGIMLHLGIEYTMNIPQFEWFMITSYILFVKPEDLERIINWIKLQLGKKPSLETATSE